MKFCSICDNMLYINTEGSQLAFKCKNCGFVDTPTNNGSVLISERQVDNPAAVNLNNYLTTNIKYDPSLPHVNNIRCPNCKISEASEAKEDDVIYIKYDAENMKYLYFCCKCDHFWTLENKSVKSKK